MSKFKFTWGHGVIVALLCFIIFICSLVFFAGNMGEMVEDNYYEKTVVYQDEIDAANRANDLDAKPEIIHQANGFLIRFPFKPESGKVLFLRLNNSELDVKQDLQLNNRNEQLIHEVDLTPGEYEVSIHWVEKGQTYLIKETVNWNTPSS